MMPGKKTYSIKFITQLVVLLMVFVPFTNLEAQNTSYKAQSLYIYNFLKYITWPEHKNTDNFVIGIYGNSPIVEELQIMASLKKASGGGNILVKKIDNLDDIGELHILYIASSKSREMSTINNTINNKCILTVAEREGLALKGAIVSFLVMENNLLKFEVNKNLLEQRNLEISPQLLELGYIVE